MAFESLREQLRDQWSDLSSKIQETSAYNTLQEKFESQTPGVQRAIIGGGIAVVALMILAFPMSYISSSNQSLEFFEENRSLIQGLLKAASSAKEAPPLPPPAPHDVLRSRIEQMLRSNQLLADQIGDFQPMPTGGPNAIIPSTITQTGMAVQIKKVNVAQLVDLANGVGNMGSGNKLIGMDVTQSAGQTHYYDVILKVMNYGLPSATDESSSPPSRGSKAPNEEGFSEDEE